MFNVASRWLVCQRLVPCNNLQTEWGASIFVTPCTNSTSIYTNPPLFEHFNFQPLIITTWFKLSGWKDNEGVKVEHGLNWLKVGSIGGSLWTPQWTFGFLTRRKFLDLSILPSQGRLCTVNLMISRKGNWVKTKAADIFQDMEFSRRWRFKSCSSGWWPWRWR